jgi:ribosomal protein S8
MEREKKRGKDYMKVNVDYYVRTKNHIRRVVKIENDFIYLDKMVRENLENTYDRVYINDVNKYFTKASSKILDVLKKGDYINGYKVLDIVIDKDIPVFFVDSKRGYIKLSEIKEILTKELYEKERYLMGE